MYQVLLKRFARGLASGAVASMIVILPSAIQNPSDLKVWITALLIAGTVGGITGLLQAVDKYLRYE